MRARAATVGDLESVFRDLSKRISDEYVAAGKDSKIAYDNLMMNLKEGRAHALVQGEKTVALIAGTRIVTPPIRYSPRRRISSVP